MASQGSLRDLTRRFRSAGRLEAIIVRPSRDLPAEHATAARLVPGRGLLGDRRAERERQGDSARKRELTLIQHEHLPLIAAWCGLESVDPARLRRNLVISGVNLLAMRSPFADRPLRWRIGQDALIQITGPCDPCSLMEKELGVGGYNALRGHGGLTAWVVREGDIAVGDVIAPEG